jgi:hypothetical protein
LKIFKTRVFDRWANDEGLTDAAICDAVKEMKDGLFDADLGGGLFKKRIAKQGKGKSGGFRTLLATNRGDKWFFIFGFQKNERSNIDKDEKEALKKLASQLLSYNNELLNKAITAKELTEVICNEKN